MSFECELNDYLARKNLRHSVLFMPVTYHVPGKNTREVIGMFNKATAKIKAEMDKNKENGYVQCIGNFLLQHLTAHPGDADKIAAENKTITGSLDDMRNIASKKKIGNVAVLTPEEGYGAILKYFGLTGDVKSAPVVTPPVATEDDFDINLGDLLDKG